VALQGNLRDFSVPEILQLLGSQKKTGCLTMEWNSERSLVFLHEGQIVSTRSPGLTREDSLLAFLLKVHRITEEQHKGLVAIQKESNRDAEELLQTGGYLNAVELPEFIERLILDDLMKLVRWESGTYRFDPNHRWPHAPLVKLGLEPSLIEASRRVDEHKRFVSVFRDPYRQIAVHDLPDPNQQLSDAERDLFGIIDGQRTVEEVVRLAPLSEYEAYETLHRMLESKWIELTGRRDPGETAKAVSREAKVRVGPRRPVLWELVVLGAVVGFLYLARLAGRQLAAAPPQDPENDVFAAAQMRNVRTALELYRRENGSYPAAVQDMVDDHWITAGQTRVEGYVLRYRPPSHDGDYRLELQPDR
jgi:uncharacterized protein DUF4388